MKGFTMFPRWQLCSICILLFQAYLVSSSISKYDAVELPENHLLSRTVAMYTSKNAPFGSGTSYCAFELEVKKFGGLPKLQAVLFHSDVQEYIGQEEDGSNFLCCWKELYDKGKCDVLGDMILQPQLSNPGAHNKFYYWEVDWSDFNATHDNIPDSVTFQAHTDFHVAGVWRLYFVNCGTDREATDDSNKFEVSGSIQFMNPYGHLPGTMIGSLPLFFILVFGYLSAGIAWAVLSFMHRKELMGLQIALGAVIIAGFVQNLVFALDYLVYNYTGTISLAFNVFSVLFLSIKETLGFVCLLLVSMGYTVTKPTLEKEKWKYVIAVAVAEFVFSGLAEFMAMLRYTPQTQHLEVPEVVEYLFLIPATVLNVVFLLWIFYSLYKTILYLTQQKQSVKLLLFKRLAITLAVAYLVSFFFFCIQLIALWGGLLNSWWRGWFFFDGYWFILHFVLLCIIGFFWRPTANNSRYAYSTQLSGKDNEVDLPEVTERGSEQESTRSSDESSNI